MKEEVHVIFLVTLSLLAKTAMTDASSSSITVQPGPVEVKQGNNVTLWCQVKEDTERVVPVHWQSPPSFRTRSTNCVSFVRDKYGIACGESPSTWWYNMTIKDIQWADMGKYRCIYTRHMSIVDLEVLVPVRDVSLTYIVSNNTSKPLVLSQGIDAVLTCSADCAYPAPMISWFENGQPFKGSATVITTESGCSGEKQGQKRTISSISVRGEDVQKGRKESIISCEAGNVFGEKNISKAIVVTYDDPCEKVWCHPGRVCQATFKSTGVCVCGPPDLCNDHRKQVCGDDGIMYSSHCELHRTACIKHKHIGVDHTNIKCIYLVTTSPPQIIIGDIVAAVVVPVLVFPILVISIVVLVRRRPKEMMLEVVDVWSAPPLGRSETTETEKEVMKPRHKLEEDDVQSAPPLGTSETTETKPQLLAVADLVDLRYGSADSEHWIDERN